MTKYQCYYNKWSKWCLSFDEVQPLPAQSQHVLLFIVSLMQDGESFSVIESCFYSIKHFHKIADLPDPTDTNLIKYVLDAAKRSNRKQRGKKQPMTKENIVSIHESLKGGNMSLLDLRNFTMMTLAYSGFFRYSEVSNLMLGDLVFKQSFVKIFVEHSKNDQYRDGAWVLVAKSSSDTCPVTNLQNYINRAGIAKENEFLFRATTFFKSTNSHRLKKKNKPISYTTARSAILTCVKRIGLNEKAFGTHSLRRGGATSAANNGVSDRLFQNHGRWKSVSSKDGYVEDNIENLLSVSLGLGL